MARKELSELVTRGESLADRYPRPEELAAACARLGALPPPPLLGPFEPRRWHRRAPGLPEAPAGTSRKARVCIATPDLVGPIRNGGVGTAYTALARALAAAGHEVTLLYTLGRHCEAGHIGDWVEQYRAWGITLVPLPDLAIEVKGPRGVRESHLTYQWLKSRPFDVVHFPEMTGVGFQCVQAKRLGMAFSHTVLCVGLHSPTLWHRLTNDEPLDHEDLLALDFLERQSVALADVLVSPSNYLIDWVCSQGWAIPERTFVQPYVQPVAEARPLSGAAQPVREIAFFGRLEARKGLGLFCDAIERLAKGQALRDAAVLFLGKPGRMEELPGDEYLRTRTAGWTTRWSLVTDLAQPAAIERLKRPGTLAVMPSLADNTPNTVLECLATGIPFVSTRVGGIPETIAEADHRRVLADPLPEALADRIAEALRSGQAPAHGATGAAEVLRGWVCWHRLQLEDCAQPAVPPQSKPLVSVCIATRNRGAQLSQALESLEVQTYPRLEVIVADDGSDDAQAIETLAALGPALARRGGRLLRGPRRFPGACRNWAAAHARGEYLLFMDDDNVAKPHEVETLVACAERSKIPILTAACDTFRSERAPTEEGGAAFRWSPIGGALPLGVVENVIGDTNLLIRRADFFALGRFDEEPGAGLIEDWVLLSRALRQGLEVAAVPESLFWYRLWDEGHGQRHSPRSNYLRSLRPHLSGLLPELAQLVLYAGGLHRRVKAQERASLQEATEERRLSTRFQKARPVLRVGRQGAEHLRPLFELEVTQGAEGIELLSLGSDPQLTVPAVPLQQGVPLLSFELSAPVSSALQVFWMTGETPYYCEPNSLWVPLTGGRNTGLLELPCSEAYGPIRIDPSTVAGRFVLHDLELRIEAPAVEPRPPRVPRPLERLLALPGGTRLLGFAGELARRVIALERGVRGGR